MSFGAYDPDEAVQDWARVPVDELGYLSGSQIRVLTATQRVELLCASFRCHFARDKWRNRGGCLERFMGPDDYRGKTVMDFGCGFGLDGLLFALRGANVLIADINLDVLQIAHQNGAMAGVLLEPVLTSPRAPYFVLDRKVDLFWSMGCLHHTPEAGPILERACSYLNPGGKCKVLLYSDRMWRRKMGCDLWPGPISECPRLEEWVRKSDPVGHYTDWYDADKVKRLVRPFASAECDYLSDDELLGAVITPR